MRWNERPDISAIDRIFEQLEFRDLSALVVYDPSKMVWREEYHFVAVARTREKVREAIELPYGWGFGGGGSEGDFYYTGLNGLYGEEHKVVRDFRPRVKQQPMQEGVFFLPVVGIIRQPKYTPHVIDDGLERCVECANPMWFVE